MSISLSHITIDESEDWHYEIPDGYFDSIGELIEEYQNHDLVKEAFNILEKGDLQDYSERTQKEISQLEQASLKEYLDESRTSDVLGLRTDIKECNVMLENMSSMMHAFEKDLGAISMQIQTLLDDSVQIQTTLENRRSIEVELEFLTSNIVIDDELIAGIYRAPMNETFMHYVKQLSKKRAFIQSQRARSESSLLEYNGSEDQDSLSQNQYILKALEDLEPELQKLCDKMVGRIRHFLLHKIYSLQKPSTNIQILQQNLIKYRPLYSVLVDYNLDVASEIKTQYIHVVNQIFYPNFKIYVNSLIKQASEMATKYETIGQLDAGRNKVSPGLFALGDRGKIILENDHSSSSIIPHIAASEKKHYHFERIFLSLHRVLIDTVSGEMAFQNDFFNSDLFNFVFNQNSGNSVISLYEENIEYYLSNCHDAIGALLMMIIVEGDFKTMNSRGFNHLDQYLAKLKQKLSTRIQFIFDNHIESITSIQMEDLGQLDPRPHYLTRRYAEFSAAINTLILKLDSDANRRIIAAKAKSLHIQFQQLLMRMAEELALTDETRHKVFLVNNYDLILDVLTSHSLDNVVEAQEFRMHFDGELIHCVDHELNTHFRFLLDFIKQRTAHPEDSINDKEVLKFAKLFNSNWKSILKKISTEMMRSFPNLRTGTLIMQRIFTQVITYYKRFEEIIKSHHKDLYTTLQVEIVPISTLTYEMKLYTTDFD